MPPYLDLYDGYRDLGRFDLPGHITTTKGIYRVGYALRQGGNGVVFNISQMQGFQQFNVPFALKIQKRLDASRIDRFDNELRVLQMCDHPRIARYRDHGDLDWNGRRVPWLVVSLGAENLRRHVDEHGPLPPDKLKSVGAQICDAIEHLHGHGFIHRDIKPENFVWENEQRTTILMIDFGTAKRLGEDVSARPLDNFTQAMEFVGPVFFSSPELIAYASDKNHPVGVHSDFFQIGKLLWYLGMRRISAGVPSAHLCPFGGAFRQLVLELIADEPNERIPNLATIRNRISNL